MTADLAGRVTLAWTDCSPKRRRRWWPDAAPAEVRDQVAAAARAGLDATAAVLAGDPAVVAPGQVASWARLGALDVAGLPHLPAPPPIPERASIVTPGCVGRRCSAAPGGRGRCPTCRVVTVCAERTTGPRLPTCSCLGDDVAVCLHPAAAPSRGTTVRRASDVPAERGGR